MGQALVIIGITLGCVGLDVRHACAGSMNGKRAILDETMQFWTTKEAADHTLSRIKEAGFNVYIPVVWYGTGTTWPSRLAPWDPSLTARAPAGFDPLRYVIEKAHSMGIEVHPWFTVALRRSDLFPDLALDGVLEGGKLGIFDIHNPRFRALITDLIVEVARNYDVDGINLDYIRAMGLCLTSPCRKEYRARYNRELAMDAVAFRVAPQTVPSLIDYQQSTVTDLVRSIASAVRAVKPAAVISADAYPELTDHLNGQNSVEWVNQGYVDVLFRMDYARTVDIAATESVRRRLKEPDRLTLVLGNYDMVQAQARPRSGPWLIDVMNLVGTRWPRTGIAVYLYNQLSDEHIEALKNRYVRRASGDGTGATDVRMR